MKQIINGKGIDIPVNSDGSIEADTLRQLARIPTNRALVLQQPDGRNRIVNPGERLAIQPLTTFVDAPLHERGAEV